jgi:hypothetical protein
VRTVLDKPDYRLRAKRMADEFGGIDTRSEILRIVNELAHRPTTAVGLPRRQANAVRQLEPQLAVSKSRVHIR